MENLTTTQTNNSLKSFQHSQIELIPGLPNDVALECLVRVPISSHPILRKVSQAWNDVISDPSFYSTRRRMGSAERLLCLIQPLSPHAPPHAPPSKGEHNKEATTTHGPPVYNMNVYNITRHEWRRMSVPIPTFAQCVPVPGSRKVVVLGGWETSTLMPINSVIVIDLSTGTWKHGSPMLTARSFFACTAVGPKVYVAGGHDGQKNALRSAEVYDVASDEWRALPPMLEERDECQGFAFGGPGLFWVVSGYETESQGRFRPDAEIYDPNTGSWTRVEGVWPYSGTTPKSTTVTAGCDYNQGLLRWWFVKNGEVREFDWEQIRWKGVNSGPIPKRVIGSSSISLVNACDGDRDGEIFVMGNGECDNCEEEGSGGEGVFVVEERENDCVKGKGETNGGDDGKIIRWKHVHAPSRFLGFPFSASHVLV